MAERACIANDTGRVSWIEALGPEPAGDCDGPLHHVLGAVADLCERHLLQYHLGGRLLLASLITEASDA